ncbi:DNA-binding domain-containing protein [Lactiplantibacillus plantarum]|uniref:DNA-binding domain-containing protein n=1 Tax=Lactiplantibacillus plantarum TaxID=1590 RepID=UPI0028FC138C|nr:DNA-binding domain-containing protein [Lactiplantibacillus plantarum]WNW20319.1 DNA-binding domain-containing protein [Lactiplantibacillus plantarum]
MYLDEIENEISIEYANSLYGYKNVRSEMRYLTGDRLTGGKVSLKNFLTVCCKNVMKVFFDVPDILSLKVILNLIFLHKSSS